MAINIEVKHRISALEARITSLEHKIQVLEAKQTVPSITVKEPKEPKEPKKCPHCGIAPAYFFHVKNCPKKNKNGDERSGDSGNS